MVLDYRRDNPTKYTVGIKQLKKRHGHTARIVPAFMAAITAAMTDKGAKVSWRLPDSDHKIAVPAMLTPG